MRGSILELNDLAEALAADTGDRVLSEALPDSVGEDVRADVAEALTDGSHYPDSQEVWDAIGAIDEADAQVEIQRLRGKVARALGYQAVRTPDEFDGQTVMVLDPSQIKSATGNVGTFDSSSSDIRFSLTDPKKFKDVPSEQSGPVLERHAKAQRSIFSGQPIDGIFRFLFDATGQVDAAGRWKPGVKIEQAMKKALLEWKPYPDGSFGWMNHALESVRAGLIDQYGLDAEYTQREFQSHAEQASIESLGADFVERIAAAGVGFEEAQSLQRILNGEDVGDANLRGLSQPIREAIDELGQQLVSLGLLKAETYHKNLGKYIRRSYARHVEREQGLPRWAQTAMRKHRRKIHGDELKARGLKEDVTMDRLPSSSRWRCPGHAWPPFCYARVSA